MRKIIITTLMAAATLPAIAAPTMASAQSARELHRDRQDIREERRDVRDAYRRGDRDDIRDERKDLRHAKQEYREDWRDYRKAHRDVYARGHWEAPYRYRAWDRGVVLHRQYYAPRYYVNDPWRYRLADRGPELRWVRNYDDVLLVNIRTGRVIDVYRNFFW